MSFPNQSIESITSEYYSGGPMSVCSCGPVRVSSRSFSFWTAEVRMVKSPEMFQTRRAEMREACKLTGQYARQGSCIRLLTLLRHSNLHWQGFWGCPVATSFYRLCRRRKLEWEDEMLEGRRAWQIQLSMAMQELPLSHTFAAAFLGRAWWAHGVAVGFGIQVGLNFDRACD